MTPDYPKKWAVVVGINSYERVTPLQYCRNDAVAIEKVLRESLGFDPDDILMFVEDSKFAPTLSSIYHHLGLIKEKGNIGADDLLLFYFAGHGMIGKDDGKDYLLPIDATTSNLKKTGIRVEDIVGELKATGCKNIVMFIDACREHVMGTRGAITSIGEDSAEALKAAGVVTFFSCNPRDKSYEIEQLHHGSFTFCVLDAIAKGEAETVSSLASYLRRQVPQLNADYKRPPQQPYTIIEPEEKGKLRIFANPGRRERTTANIEQLRNGIGDFFAEDKLKLVYFNKIIEHLDEQIAGQAQEGDKKMVFIRQLCAGEMTMPAFEVAWDANERRQGIAAAKQTKLE